MPNAEKTHILEEKKRKKYEFCRFQMKLSLIYVISLKNYNNFC